MTKDDFGLVGSSCGMTVLLDGFQSVRIDCWMALPANVKDFKKVHKRCEKFVYSKVKEDVSKIYARHKELSGSVSTVDVYNKRIKENG